MTTFVIGKRGTKGSKSVTVEGKTLKMAGMKKLAPVGEVLGSLPKGEARKLRMNLRANGFPALAGTPRIKKAA